MDLPDALYERLGTVLEPWISKSVTAMSFSNAMAAADPDPIHLIRLVRCIAFLYATVPKSLSSNDHALYGRTMSVLGSRCIRNYSSFVLQPIVSAIKVQLGKKGARLLELVNGMVSVVNLWVKSFPSLVAQLHEVRSRCPSIEHAQTFTFTD
jgi:hypothetical protein